MKASSKFKKLPENAEKAEELGEDEDALAAY